MQMCLKIAFQSNTFQMASGLVDLEAIGLSRVQQFVIYL